VTALTRNGDIEVVAGGDINALFQRDLSGRAGGEDVQAEDLLYVVHNPFFDQLTRPARRYFLSRLEDKLDAAMQLVLQAAEHFRCAHQHCGVGIVTAGVHHAGFAGAKGFPALFLQWQSVNIRPQRPHWAWLISVQYGNHADLDRAAQFQFRQGC
jgi:hypothetical protein